MSPCHIRCSFKKRPPGVAVHQHYLLVLCQHKFDKARESCLKKQTEKGTILCLFSFKMKTTVFIIIKLNSGPGINRQGNLWKAIWQKMCFFSQPFFITWTHIPWHPNSFTEITLEHPALRVWRYISANREHLRRTPAIRCTRSWNHTNPSQRLWALSRVSCRNCWISIQMRNQTTGGWEKNSALGYDKAVFLL